MIAPVSQLSAVGQGAAQASDMDKLKAVAKQFEAVFLRQMIGSMRQAGLGDELFNSSATDQFRDMQDSETANHMAEKGVLGVADLLVKQFAARVGGAEPAQVSAKPVVKNSETGSAEVTK